MDLAPGWTVIVACPVGGRDVVLFYDEVSGKAQTAYINLNGKGVPLKTFTLSPGWGSITFCNRRLFFFNENTGLAVIGAIGRDGEFSQSAITAAIGPGRTLIVSDGHHLWVRQAGKSLVCTLGLLVNPSTDGFGIGLIIVRQEFWTWDVPVPSGTIVAGRDMIVEYFVEYREHASISFSWIDEEGEFQGRYPRAHADPNWSTCVLSNGYILFYDDGVGGGKITDGSPDYSLESLPWKSANISSTWSHLISVGARILFYDANSGDASVGYITPDGDFSGETKL